MQLCFFYFCFCAVYIIYSLSLIFIWRLLWFSFWFIFLLGLLAFSINLIFNIHFHFLWFWRMFIRTRAMVWLVITILSNSIDFDLFLVDVILQFLDLFWGRFLVLVSFLVFPFVIFHCCQLTNRKVVYPGAVTDSQKLVL
uniref:Uncharacterized protein n=1 Tax=Cacopsylla melanoneura TaxID=428564 RepID=A0A8D8QML8_9HEMI